MIIPHQSLTHGHWARRCLHPEAGLFSIDYTHPWFGRRSEIRLTTYTPADEETERNSDTDI
jgi:hypothetical protein